MTSSYNRYDRHSFLGADMQRLPSDVRLIVSRGQTGRRVRPVSGPIFTLGAGEVSDLVLGDQQFAELHCYLCLRDGTVTLRQVSHGPMITVNGRVVRWGEVVDGDRIRTGPYEFLVKIGQQETDNLPGTDELWDAQHENREQKISTDQRLREECEPSDDPFKSSWRATLPRWRSVTTDKGFSIRAK